MSITLAAGSWMIPAAITVGLIVGWRMFGIRMSPQNGSMFPDAVGGIAEAGGYLVAALLSAIAWLVWGLIG